MLPSGAKSISEIAAYADSADRVTHFARLLEHILKSVGGQADAFLTFDELLEKHKEKFTDFARVDKARWVRNQLVHATGKASPRRIIEAERSLKAAVEQALTYCRPELRTAVTGAEGDVKDAAISKPPVADHRADHRRNHRSNHRTIGQ